MANTTNKRDGEIRRVLWAFEPDADVTRLIARAISVAARRAKPGKIRNLKTKGLRSKIINEALRLHFAKLAGKRDKEFAA